ncbi:MAG: site-specific DNA-methyltransferase [Paludibacteraceae bacterium]|nr:site-specific DNA-methyltransferase [Paludibacteraceae bacterium]
MTNPQSIVYKQDCVEYMQTLPDKFFDLAICDPPYGIGGDKPSVKPDMCKQKNGSWLHVDAPNYGKKDWDIQPQPEYFEQLFRVSKSQIIFGANYFGLRGGMIVWDKMNGDSDQYGCEIAYQSFDTRTDIVRFMWSGMIQGRTCSRRIQDAMCQQGNKKLNEKRYHPCQKPVALYAWLLRNYAKEGDKIFDSHLDSGSSRIAAYELGFDFVGCEIDEQYYSMQEKRFYKECLQQTKMF